MTLDIISQILVVLAVAVFLGEVFEQVNIPAVAGELLAGLLLGPTVLGVVASDAQIQALSSISLFFIIFLIGLEMNTKSVRAFLKRALVVTTTSFFIPFLLALIGAFILLPFGLGANAIFALAIAVPSISIISVLVMQYDLLEKETGQLILSSVTMTDMIAFVILAGISRGTRATLPIVLDIVVFIVAFAFVDFLINYRPKIFQVFLQRASVLLKREDISYATLIIIGLSVAVIFQAIGLSYVLGSFFAGLIVHDGLIGRKSFRKLSETFATINRAFFIPLFFGFAGTEAVLVSQEYYLLIPVAGIILVSTISSIVLTRYAAERVLRVKEKGGARQIATILGGRGAVGIVIATVAAGDGLLSQSAYSLVIVGTLAVSITVPLLARSKSELQ